MCVKAEATTQNTVQDKRQWRKSLNVTVVIVLQWWDRDAFVFFSLFFCFPKCV